MKIITSIILLITALNTYSTTLPDLIFKNGMEFRIVFVNDTGVTFAGEYPNTNVDCINATISSPQDCHQGRDATDNDDSDGHAGFSFIKLDAKGAPLIDQSIDYATTPWACVEDNVTGLIWEVKNTIADDIHNRNDYFKWGGISAIGRGHSNAEGSYNDDWNELVNGSNAENLCGYSNWRVPTNDELLSIVDYGTYSPSIDTNYFPNNISSWYWTSSAYAGNSNDARVVFFSFGYSSHSSRNVSGYARLVRTKL